MRYVRELRQNFIKWETSDLTSNIKPLFNTNYVMTEINFGQNMKQQIRLIFNYYLLLLIKYANDDLVYKI